MSTVIDTLVFDRDQADLDRLADQKAKILTNGWASLTAEEQAEWLAGMRGAYNYVDMNRVGAAVAYIAGRFIDIPHELDAYRAEKGVADGPLYTVPYDPAAVVVSPKTNWTVQDTPTDADAVAYLKDLSVLRSIISLPADTPAVPSSLTQLTLDMANDMERLLYVIHACLVKIEADMYRLIDDTAVGFMYADELVCGE